MDIEFKVNQKRCDTIIQNCNEIVEPIYGFYAEYIEMFKANCHKINNSIKLKELFSFTTNCIDQIYEIYVLINQKRFATIAAITRSVCESYSYIILLFNNYNDDSCFNNTIEYLYILDVEQNNKILASSNRDSMDRNILLQIQDRQKKWILEIINRKFPEYSKKIDMENFFNSINGVTKKLKKLPKYKYIHEILNNKSKAVGYALNFNEIWNSIYNEKYAQASSIYGMLCRSTHNNITSIIQRTRNESNYFVLNACNEDDYHLLKINSTIIGDIVKKLKSILYKE